MLTPLTTLLAALLGVPVLQVALTVPPMTVFSPVSSIWSFAKASATIVTLAAGDTAEELSTLVLTVKSSLEIELACSEFVSPLIVSEAAVPLPTAQVPPLSASVIVTVVVSVVAVAEQLTKLAPSTIVGVAGTTNAVRPALGKTTVIVLPALRAPVALVVNPTVQSDVAPATMDEPTKVTTVTDGSIRYGSGSDESSNRSSRKSAPSRCASDQRRPLGVTEIPLASSSSTGAIRRPVSLPPAPRNATMPSFRRVGVRPEPASRQRHVRVPWCRSTWSSCSAPEPLTVTSSCP